MNHTTPARYTPAGYRDYTLIGPPRHVLTVIANHRAAGTLVAVHTPRAISTDDPVVRVRLRLRDIPPIPATAIPSAGRPVARRIGAMVAAVAAPVLGVVLAVAYLIGQLVEWITAHAATLAGLGVLTILLIAAAMHGTRRSRHCPGC
jgi:hypothetical protein